ncbi:hypothetical protein O3M35_005935 [Rhynocoris fuscipes]|uniref:Proline-rich nuclear receptor coactivator 2 n=1 Tax=Rhynocoris fuscipes TaxID=488301 RepID=A0AAW1DE37_9HEMI
MTNMVINKMIESNNDKVSPFVQVNGKCSPSKGGKSKVRFHGGGSPTSPRGKGFYLDGSPRVKHNNSYGHYMGGGRPRCSPSKDKSPRLLSPYKEFYAGFSESPAPASLPKPPQHWIPSSLFSLLNKKISTTRKVSLGLVKLFYSDLKVFLVSWFAPVRRNNSCLVLLVKTSCGAD